MTTLPAGTVTFLFTDVEGSTTLAQQLGDDFADVIQRQRTLLRHATSTHGGHEVGTEGDGFFAVFPTARQGVAAAVAAQKALVAEAWPDGAIVRVRMGLHTGDASTLGDDYIGLDVHRAARIMAAGHGGQILVSAATMGLLGADDVAALRDLGPHRLKDLQRPERLYQVHAEGLPSSFPPLRTLSASPNNLPVQLTTFIGREAEIAQTRRLLEEGRLVSLLGPGGTGKTRLAIQVAAEMLDRFPDGVWLVELARITDPMLVAEATAGALGIHQPARSAIDAVADTLKPKKALVLLDNCEHVQEASVDLCGALLRRCPELRILATSREALAMPGELTFRVPPLPVPPEVASPDAIAHAASMQLFAERAAQHRPGFAVTSANAAAVAQICRRLDGLPLAIELAAARVKVLSPEQIAARLDDRFRLLTGGLRTDLPHQQTLRAAMDWSYSLLSPEERQLLRRLSVFVGGFTLEAAEDVGAGGPIDVTSVLDLLARLVDKSLIVVEDMPQGEPRYRFLETIRQYAHDRLMESDEAEASHRCHHDYFQRLAEEAERHLHGHLQKAWLDRLQIEHDNLRAALRWTRADPQGAEAGLRLAAALWWFWEVRGFWSEGHRWIDEMLTRGDAAPPEVRVKALNAAASFEMWSGRTRSAGALAQQSLALSQQIGDKQSESSCLVVLGIEACRLEEYRKANELGHEGLAIASQVGNNWGAALARIVLALVARQERRFDESRALLEQSLGELRALGHEWGIALVTQTLGLLANDQQDAARARTLLQEAGQRFDALGDRAMASYSLVNLGAIALAQGDVTGARLNFCSALRARHGLEDWKGIATCLAALGCVAAEQSDFPRAARLFGAAAAMRNASGTTVPQLLRAAYDKAMRATSAALDEATRLVEEAAGRAMAPDAAVSYALYGERVESTAAT